MDTIDGARAHSVAIDETRDLWNRKAAFWDERFGDGNAFHLTLVEPATLRLLDPQPGQRILDIATGNGVLARRLAGLGVEVVAVDFSPVFIERARERTRENGDRIAYHVVDATDTEALLALGTDRFDAAVCGMALMDMLTIEPLATALGRLLPAGAPFVFSVQHPCFNSNGIEIVGEVADRDGRVVVTNGVKVTGYLDIPPGKGAGIVGEPAPHYYFHRPLWQLFDPFFRAGFVLDGLEEPTFPPGGKPLSWDGVGGQIPPVLVVRLRVARAYPSAAEASRSISGR